MATTSSWSRSPAAPATTPASCRPSRWSTTICKSRSIRPSCESSCPTRPAERSAGRSGRPRLDRRVELLRRGFGLHQTPALELGQVCHRAARLVGLDDRVELQDAADAASDPFVGVPDVVAGGLEALDRNALGLLEALRVVDAAMRVLEDIGRGGVRRDLRIGRSLRRELPARGPPTMSEIEKARRLRAGLQVGEAEHEPVDPLLAGDVEIHALRPPAIRR